MSIGEDKAKTHGVDLHDHDGRDPVVVAMNRSALRGIMSACTSAILQVRRGKAPEMMGVDAMAALVQLLPQYGAMACELSGNMDHDSEEVAGHVLQKATTSHGVLVSGGAVLSDVLAILGSAFSGLDPDTHVDTRAGLALLASHLLCTFPRTKRDTSIRICSAEFGLFGAAIASQVGRFEAAAAAHVYDTTATITNRDR